MINDTFAGRFVSAIVILVMAGSTLLARSQQIERKGPSDEDKAEIIESVLQLELKDQNSVSDFANIRSLSLDNIEFVEPARISRHGFKLVTAGQILNSKKDHVVEYVVFRRISSKDGTVVVVFSRVSEGRPCFSPAFSRERSFTYEYRKNAGGWIGTLVKRPAIPISFGRGLPRNWIVGLDVFRIRRTPSTQPSAF